MNKALRKAIIAGNWKMNKNRKEAAELINALKPIAADKTCGVIICVPFTNLETALSLTEGTNIEVGAENVHFENEIYVLFLSNAAGRTRTGTVLPA